MGCPIRAHTADLPKDKRTRSRHWQPRGGNETEWIACHLELESDTRTAKAQSSDGMSNSSFKEPVLGICRMHSLFLGDSGLVGPKQRLWWKIDVSPDAPFPLVIRGS